MRTKLLAVVPFVVVVLAAGAGWAISAQTSDGTGVAVSESCCVTGDCCCPGAGDCCDQSARSATKVVKKGDGCCVTGNCCCPAAGACCAAQGNACCDKK